ncbi:MAG: hypothetical protein H6624_05545 [Bdellovibrionaceae bacterium]|nr:hypothetical protein [Bdellovibrionales bacterium]MCB9083784.1 hypothetical protein [Pseudobdellovibrionaceae bacterium]
MKILVVGGTQDFGKGLTEFFGDEAYGIGRTNGYDISNPTDVKRIVALSRDYQVVVVVAFCDDHQAELVEKLAVDWLERNHDGYLICLGSTAVYHVKYHRAPSMWSYLRAKEGLRLLGEYISHQTRKDEVKMRFTNIQVGNLDNEKSRKSKPHFKRGIQPSELGQVIHNLVHSPPHLCVHEMVLDIKQ